MNNETLASVTLNNTDIKIYSLEISGGINFWENPSVVGTAIITNSCPKLSLVKIKGYASDKDNNLQDFLLYLDKCAKEQILLNFELSKIKLVGARLSTFKIKSVENGKLYDMELEFILENKFEGV